MDTALSKNTHLTLTVLHTLRACTTDQVQSAVSDAHQQGEGSETGARPGGPIPRHGGRHGEGGGIRVGSHKVPSAKLKSHKITSQCAFLLIQISSYNYIPVCVFPVLVWFLVKCYYISSFVRLCFLRLQ